MKFKTIREGEEAVIYNHLGEGKQIQGPKRVFLFRERLIKLQQYTATADEYLKVTFNTGEVEHIPGPFDIFSSPLTHENVQVMPAIKVDPNKSLVVYRRMKNSEVIRRIVDGPKLFIPTADEWIHKFMWHAPDPEQIGRMIPNEAEFQQLVRVPDHFYYNVRDVRTNDDTVLLVKLMIFYELKDILTMLVTTQDPIADMINAVCADVITFAGKLSFSSFLESTQNLSKMNSYPQLLQRAEAIGYEVSKVVYRGYHSSDQLQVKKWNCVVYNINKKYKNWIKSMPLICKLRKIK